MEMCFISTQNVLGGPVRIELELDFEIPGWCISVLRLSVHLRLAGAIYAPRNE